MKKTIILLTLVFIAGLTYAQKGKVATASTLLEQGNIDKALETIEQAVDPNNSKSGKSIDWAKTWIVRGQIYQAIYESKDKNVKGLSQDPLTEALNSYTKAADLDKKDQKFTKDLKFQFITLQRDFSNQAVAAYGKNDYKSALKSFEQYLSVYDIPFIKADNPDYIDTVVVYNTGLTAFYAKDYDTSIRYFNKAAQTGYKGGELYVRIASEYEIQKDTAKALQTLQDAFKKYPDDNSVISEMANIYIRTKRPDDALKYLDLVIAKDPNNAQFLFAKGRLYDEMGKEDDAIKWYEKTIALDSTYFGAFFNLGAIYYNLGVKEWDVARNVPANDNAKYQLEVAKSDSLWAKALPYMEKSYKLMDKQTVATKKSTMETLKNLYYRLESKDRAKWEPKYKAMDEQIKALTQ